MIYTNIYISEDMIPQAERRVSFTGIIPFVPKGIDQNSPHEEGNMITPPCKVESPHVRALEGAQLDLARSVILIRIYVQIVCTELSRVRRGLQRKRKAISRQALERVIRVWAATIDVRFHLR